MKSVRLLLFLALAVLFAMAIMTVAGCEKAAKIKDAYIAEATTTLDDYSAKVDDLANKAALLPSPAKETAIAKIDELKAKMDEGKAKLEELKGAEASKWVTLMDDLKAIIVEIGKLYDEAVTAVGGGA
jgi:peptidoglycan hydrolase CwlO-like protein